MNYYIFKAAAASPRGEWQYIV